NETCKYDTPISGFPITGASLSPSPGTPGEGWGGGCEEQAQLARTPSLTLPRTTGGGNGTRHILSALLALFPLLLAADAPPTPITPLIHVHAHNDYEHAHPFFDAAECAFCSFEADIHLVEGKLPVAHSRAAVKPDKTLQ